MYDTSSTERRLPVCSPGMKESRGNTGKEGSTTESISVAAVSPLLPLPPFCFWQDCLSEVVKWNKVACRLHRRVSTCHSPLQDCTDSRPAACRSLARDRRRDTSPVTDGSPRPPSTMLSGVDYEQSNAQCAPLGHRGSFTPSATCSRGRPSTTAVVNLAPAWSARHNQKRVEIPRVPPPDYNVDNSIRQETTLCLLHTLLYDVTSSLHATRSTEPHQHILSAEFLESTCVQILSLLFPSCLSQINRDASASGISTLGGDQDALGEQQGQQGGERHVRLHDTVRKALEDTLRHFVSSTTSDKDRSIAVDTVCPMFVLDAGAVCYWESCLGTELSSVTAAGSTMENQLWRNQVEQVLSAHNTLRYRQIESVYKWTDTCPLTVWNNMLVSRLAKLPAEYCSSAVRLRRALWVCSCLHLATNDASSCARLLQAKFKSLAPRKRIPNFAPLSNNDCSLDNFTYPSQYAALSAAACVVLQQAFPSESKFFQTQLQELCDSLVWGGCCFPRDVQQGKRLGTWVGEQVWNWMTLFEQHSLPRFALRQHVLLLPTHSPS